MLEEVIPRKKGYWKRGKSWKRKTRRSIKAL
jgi:hypothetical protein